MTSATCWTGLVTGANETLGMRDEEAGGLEETELLSAPCVAISAREALFIEEAELELPDRKKAGKRKLSMAADVDLNLECFDLDVEWVESAGVVGRLGIARR